MTGLSCALFSERLPCRFPQSAVPERPSGRRGCACGEGAAERRLPRPRRKKAEESFRFSFTPPCHAKSAFSAHGARLPCRAGEAGRRKAVAALCAGALVQAGSPCGVSCTGACFRYPLPGTRRRPRIKRKARRAGAVHRTEFRLRRAFAPLGQRRGSVASRPALGKVIPSG